MWGLHLEGKTVEYTDSWTHKQRPVFVVTFTCREGDSKSAHFFSSEPLQDILNKETKFRHRAVGEIMLFISEDRASARLFYPEPFDLPLGKGIAKLCNYYAARALHRNHPGIKTIKIRIRGAERIVPISHVIKYLQLRILRDRYQASKKFAVATPARKKAAGRRIRQLVLRRRKP